MLPLVVLIWMVRSRCSGGSAMVSRPLWMLPEIEFRSNHNPVPDAILTDTFPDAVFITTVPRRTESTYNRPEAD